MADIVIFFQLLLVAFIVSLGFGIIFKGSRGATIVTKWWVTTICKIVGGTFHFIGDLFWKKKKGP